MKLIAMSNVLAACIALFLVGSTDAKKAGLRQLAGRPGEGDIVNKKPEDRSLGETPECAICKDMYDTLKESTSVYACEATCDTMAEALGGGPEDRTFERPAPRAGRFSVFMHLYVCCSRSSVPSLVFSSSILFQPSRTWSWQRATRCARSSSTDRRRARARDRPASTWACARSRISVDKPQN
jgi:hypothetical protein